MAINWKQFTKRIPIKAPAKAIYDAWTTQQGLESWFLRLASFTKADGSARPRSSHIEPGDRYKWLWYGYDDSTAELNEILEVNGWDQLKFGFTPVCTVTVTIKQEDGETVCELVQDMATEDVDKQQNFYTDCGTGWTFYLANLKSILEGGIDLRNKNNNLKNVVSS